MKSLILYLSVSKSLAHKLVAFLFYFLIGRNNVSFVGYVVAKHMLLYTISSSLSFLTHETILVNFSWGLIPSNFVFKIKDEFL